MRRRQVPARESPQSAWAASYLDQRVTRDVGPVFLFRLNLCARSRNRQILHAFHLLPPARNRIEDQPAGKTEECQYHHAGRQNRCWKTGNQAGRREGDDDRYGQNDGRERENGEHHGEELQRSFFLDEFDDGHKDTPAIANRVKLALRTLGARIIRGRQLACRHPQLQTMDGQFRLDLETARERGERFDETTREHAITGQHVFELPAKDYTDERG